MDAWTAAWLVVLGVLVALLVAPRPAALAAAAGVAVAAGWLLHGLGFWGYALTALGAAAAAAFAGRVERALSSTWRSSG